MRQRAKFRGDRSKPLLRNGDFSISQDGRSPPSWICDARVWITCKWYLMVFIAVKKIGRNRSGSFDNMQVLIFCDLGVKNAYSPFEIVRYGAKYGKGWCNFDPSELGITFGGCYLCATFGGNRKRYMLP